MIQSRDPSAPPRKKRERTCACCREADAPESLVRWVSDGEGGAVPDLQGKSFGRGAWLHKRPECLRGISASLSRSFRDTVRLDDQRALELLGQAGEALCRRLLGAAKRQGHLVFGAEMASESFEVGRCRLLLVARDARAASDVSAVSQALSRGILRVFGDKSSLGALFGRSEVGIVSVEDERLASALIDAIALALLASGTHGAPANGSPESIEKAEVE